MDQVEPSTSEPAHSTRIESPNQQERIFSGRGRGVPRDRFRRRDDRGWNHGGKNQRPSTSKNYTCDDKHLVDREGGTNRSKRPQYRRGRGRGRQDQWHESGGIDSSITRMPEGSDQLHDQNQQPIDQNHESRQVFSDCDASASCSMAGPSQQSLLLNQNISIYPASTHKPPPAMTNSIAPRRFLRSRAKNEPETKESETVQSEISENQFKSNAFECMICCDNIYRNNPIWYCTNCYNIFHLKCSIEWCNKSIKSRDEAIADSQYPSLGVSSSAPASNYSNTRQPVADGYPDYRSERQKSIEWPCPTCRKVLYSRPGKYKCFCGKVVRPEINRHLTPHSCGQMCARQRPNADCPHLCNAICHPGRCNPCSLTSKKSCHCGKLTQEIKCVAQVGSCGEPCDKLLNCGRHRCSRACHEGSCEPCSKILSISCHCGARVVSKNCSEYKPLNGNQSTEVKFSCDKVCDKLLDCGKHKCLKRCHPGPVCPGCPLRSQNLKACPCGSTPIPRSVLETRKSCTDPLPTCDNKCNRQLVCGPDKNRHKCQKKCHTGSCPPCKLKSTIKCECLVSSRTIDCALMFEKVFDDDQQVIGFKQIKFTFKCEARCNAPKHCGKHRCQEKCCDASRNPTSRAHVCTQLCNKKLPCGSHNCQETCHPGLCGDCTNIGWTELSCHCGASVMYPPIPCGAKPPACHRPCRRAHNCGHPVKHECHDDTEKCAPCTVFVRKPCFCGVDSKDSVYCYLPGYSCGRTCKKQLSCRQHECKRICHDGVCETPNHRGVIVCSQSCPVLRFGCKHPCGLPCHGKSACPATVCAKLIEISCECGNKTDRIECHKLFKDSDNRNKMAMLNINRPDQDSIVIDLSRKTTSSLNSATKSADKGATLPSSATRKLDCDETCSIYKRNKALAEALDIAQPDLKPTSIYGEDPLKLLKEATAQDYKFVAATYNSLAKLCKSAQESERRFIFLKFPPADKLRREVVHELAYHFNCTSESRDEEPERFVIVRACRNKSSTPDFTIEQLLPVDS